MVAQRPLVAPPPASAVVQLRFDRAIFALSADVLRAVLEPQGTLLRIWIDNRFGYYVFAWAEFATPEEAARAAAALHGNDLYAGCCTISAEVCAAYPSFRVLFQSPKSYDRDPAVPPGPTEAPTPDDAASAAKLDSDRFGAAGPPSGPPPPPVPGFVSAGRPTQAPLLSTPTSVAPSWSQPSLLAPTQGWAQSAAATGAPMHSGAPHTWAPVAQNTAVMQPAWTPVSAPVQRSTSVLAIEGLDARITPEGLFNLAGVFATVLRLQMLHDPGRALVEVDAATATAAAFALDRLLLLGREITVTVAGPGPLGESARVVRASNCVTPQAAARDFTGMHVFALHQALIASSQRPRLPSRVVLFQNAPAGVGEARVRALLRQMGAPECRRAFVDGGDARAGGRARGQLEFAIAQEAIDAVLLCNYANIDGEALVLTFAESPAGR